MIGKSQSRKKIMKKYSYILLMSIACMVALNSCLGNGGETIPLEFETPKGDISPVDGIPNDALASACLLYTSPSPRDRQKSRMPSSA